MTRAIPEHWVERLFDRMQSIWGARFADFWRNSPEPDAVKAVWREGLADLTDNALRRGVAALIHEKAPPTLPRFRELCHVDPMYVAPSVPVLTHEHRITPVGIDNKAKIDAILAKHRLPKREPGPGTDGIKWAFKILREANERDVPLNKLANAQDAIRNWCASHGCSRDDFDENGDWIRDPIARHADDVELPPLVDSPHIYREREPGDDDEEIAA
ncbi:hypothetical protein AWB78_07813 [Caballeronia calidae]|uniref:Uncharacterized protein n=1 Tax=Caballeronia calidae TaxID=1777139 RepID=A0A158EGH7_9BURK|nr:hypothetical protein [Caballeronia calidae]SAL05989.1 hypothetical protein AWB78_07813 [Caballeronia calidae]